MIRLFHIVYFRVARTNNQEEDKENKKDTAVDSAGLFDNFCVGEVGGWFILEKT